MYISQENTAALVNIKLTDKGRELLTKGLRDDSNFDIVKFAFGDSEVDYRLYSVADDSKILSTLIMEPANQATDLKTKLYASGVVPSGTPVVNLSPATVDMTQYQTNINVSVSTTWLPVDGNYVEEYSWTNLGPLTDYDFRMTKSVDTSTATLTTYDTTGSTTVKVQGQTSGKYALLTLNIT